MNSIKPFLSAFVMAGVFTLTLSCKEDDPAVEAIVATTVTDIAADPGTGTNPTTGQPIGTTGKFKLFSFKTGAVVPNADSVSTKWDIGFRRTTIILNGGTSGPGNAGALILSQLFDEVKEAPADGYLTDNKATNPATFALPSGSGRSWYTYDAGANVIKPTAGRVLIIRTADGKYAKVEMLSYYKGNKSAPTSEDLPAYYSFRYVYQPNDSKSFQ
jgi:HmuY protein